MCIRDSARRLRDPVSAPAAASPAFPTSPGRYEACSFRSQRAYRRAPSRVCRTPAGNRLQPSKEVLMNRPSRLAFALSLFVTVFTRPLFAQTARALEPQGASKGAPAAPAVERAATDSPRTTPAGTTFMLPSEWSMTTRGPMVVLDPPEPDSHLVIVDVPGAKDSDAAIAAAWSAYRPDAKRPLKIVQPQAAQNGWEERKFYEYETSPNERATVFGQAW